MDTQDREHFKTIGSALDARPNASQAKPNKETSASCLDPRSCLQKANLIAGCYRRDEAQNPEAFAAALALVLGDYPASVVEYAADPRTGVIKRFPMGLPNVGQIAELLEEIQETQDRMRRYASMPKMQKALPRPLSREPNLFVPNTDRLYEKVVKDHEETGGKYSRFVNGYVCGDGARRDGILVPLLWHADPGNTAADSIAEVGRRIFEKECKAAGIDPAGGVSPSLLKTLGQAAE